MNDKLPKDDVPPFRPSLLQTAWYELGLHLSTLAMIFGFSMRVRGSRNMPQTGSVLLVSNHQSFLDPVLVGVAVRRHLAFLGRKSLFRNPLFGWLIRSLNAVPIDQEGVGKEGIKTVVEQLKQGRAVLVFPEGSRTADGQMQPLRPGIHLLIRRAESLILPVGIAGAFEAYPLTHAVPTPAPLFLPANPGTLAACIGKPIPSSQFADAPREEVLKRLFDEIHSLHLQAERLRRR